MEDQTISNEIDRYLTYKEVCSYLSISMSTLRRWIKEGQFAPVIKIYGTRRVKFFDLQTWIDSLEEK